MGMRMVLCNKELMDEICEHASGEATGTNYNEAIKALEAVIPSLGNIPEQRKSILKLLNTNEKDAQDDVCKSFKKSIYGAGIQADEIKYFSTRHWSSS
eukprot:14953206-Ditylum_brightwellii.AAC.1